MNLHELDGDYEILGELGRGGTAIVYRARERALGRDVAIKVVRSSHADDEEAVARLAREAKLVASLRHPSIVPLLGIRRLEDGLALIMQHVPGRTLKAAIREHGPMPIALVEHVLREIGSALDYAHKRHGIVHRDIKPENIYLDDEINRALLADFGIARSNEGDSNLTLVGTALGTPAYMSPEQIDGTVLDGRSDLYSLGLVAYEMLTAQQPWAGNNLYTIIYKQKHEELPPIADVRNDVPRYLERIVETLLRKNPMERYADGAQMLADIPNAASAAVTMPVPAVESKPAPEVVYEDSPTVRYQRPTFLIAESEVEPAPEPVVEAAPAIVATADVALPSALDIAAIVETTAPVRSGWRLPMPVRGGLANPTFAANAEVTEVVETATTFDFVDVTRGASRKKRMVAALTIVLLLGGAATVVAMRGVGISERDADTTAPAANPLASTTTTSFVKASGMPVSNPAVDVAGATEPASNAPVASEPAAKADSVPRLAVPRVAIPEISLSSAGRQVNAADFSSAAAPSGSNSTAANNVVSDAPSFTPHTVKPELRNREAVQRALSDYYPPVLRERKIGGTVRLWVLIDNTGKVIRSQINESSGNAYLDEAAAKVADVMTFTPALNRDQKVSVWIQLPIIFKTK